MSTKFASYIAVGVILIVPFLWLPPYIQDLVTKILCFSIFAIALNLILGFTGLFSFGHAAFFGGAAYCLAIMKIHYGIENFWLVAPISILVATLLAALFGLIALRLRGTPFILITLALGQLIYSVAWKWRLVTGGITGLAGVGFPVLGIPITWDKISFYYFTLVFFVICLFLLYRITTSTFGYTLQGICVNEARMRSLGYNTWLHKYIAFVISGLFSGVGGVLFAYWAGMVNPVHCSLETSVLVVLAIIIGGYKIFFGPIIGVTVILVLQYFVSIYIPERWPLILGAVFVLTIMLLRQGICGYLVELWKKRGV